MSTKADEANDLKIDMYHLLNRLFNGVAIKYNGAKNSLVHMGDSEELVDGSTKDSAHHYVRDKFQWYHPSYIFYKNSALALAQVKPHNTILIYNVLAKNRFARNLLINTLHNHFPKVKVLYEGG